jgi:hypothetical protein
MRSKIHALYPLAAIGAAAVLATMLIAAAA